MSKFLEKLKGSFALQTVFFIVSLFFLFACYFVSVEQIKFKNIVNSEVVWDNKVSVGFNEISNTENKLNLSGWIFRQDSKVNTIQVLLKSTGKEDIHLMKTTQSKSERITTFFKINDNCGDVIFDCHIDHSELEASCYEVFLVIQYVDNTNNFTSTKTIQTGKYIYNKKIYTYNPEGFIKPDFDDEMMNNVVNLGEVCLYDANESIYVYLYDDNLYWIAGDAFKFNSYGKTYIAYQVGTSDLTKIPEDTKKYGFINLDYYFENNELNIVSPTGLRVAMCEVPKNIPITYIYTSNYDLENGTTIWNDVIYPY